jgi:hypothetical protein
MISFEHKFIFIHVPKTAGNSVQAALLPHCSDRVVLRPSNGNVADEDGLQGLDVFNERLGFNTAQHKHATLSMYHEKLGEEIHDFLIFLCVRNPWDRLVSQTCFRNENKLPEAHLSFEEVFWPRPILPFVEIDGKPEYDAVIRFENLQGDFDAVCATLNLGKIQLPHKNKSKRTGVRSYISAELSREISVRYASDIEEFGYGCEHI